MDIQYEITVHGRVQGVGFRAAARNRARDLKLRGWVENRRDGSVRVLVRGSEKSCSEFIQWCRKGSGYSWVERLEIREMPPEPLPPFTVRY